MFGVNNFPVYRQLNQMDCGPTCLKFITDFYGGNYNLNYLREISCLQKGGVSNDPRLVNRGFIFPLKANNCIFIIKPHLIQ
ncbi:cysteine peptidase family C39 domain-containing protein [Salegentibacter salegens]|uniref:cysteine peptidase family C39 domain-containing protein n=1 Tax=Salegentibacter salegens TaxID=143223 RepID=UPI0021D02138|nr:cysteine peptidase family C39 domain-containing protein [Salegentibacter salegens]